MNSCVRVLIFGLSYHGRAVYKLLDRSIGDQTLPMVNLISYCDGNHSLLQISEILDELFWKLITIVKKLAKHKLLINVHS